MNDIIFGCNTTNKFNSGSYDYFLFSRYDNYAVIMRAKTDDTEWKFRVILQDEDIDTVFASASTQAYIRPDQAHGALKKYIVTKMKAFNDAVGRDAEQWG